jgi:hypothetical protein
MASSDNSCGLLVDLSDPCGAAAASATAAPPRGGRRSFYTLPQSLESEDDPFGLLARSQNCSSKTEEKSLMLMEEVHTGSLVQIESSCSSTG